MRIGVNELWTNGLRQKIQIIDDESDAINLYGTYQDGIIKVEILSLLKRLESIMKVKIEIV